MRYEDLVLMFKFIKPKNSTELDLVVWSGSMVYASILFIKVRPYLFKKINETTRLNLVL